MGETCKKFDRDFREGAVRLVWETGKPIASLSGKFRKRSCFRASSATCGCWSTRPLVSVSAAIVTQLVTRLWAPPGADWTSLSRGQSVALPKVAILAEGLEVTQVGGAALADRNDVIDVQDGTQGRRDAAVPTAVTVSGEHS